MQLHQICEGGLHKLELEPNLSHVVEWIDALNRPRAAQERMEEDNVSLQKTLQKEEWGSGGSMGSNWMNSG